jgi:hypothetical protein
VTHARTITAALSGLGVALVAASIFTAASYVAAGWAP